MEKIVRIVGGGLAGSEAAYQLALEKSDPRSQYRALIEMKLDAIGQAK